jgi:uncharacterized membrane protein YraQ (UPF0718 family)
VSLTAIIINALALALLVFAFIKDRKKAMQSLIAALKAGFKILPMVLIIVALVGLLLGFVPPESISAFIGEQSGFGGVMITALLGAVLHIPALISFPLAGSLLQAGASIAAIAAFITTLTMIGTITLPLEINILGKKMALLRNGLSFIIAVAIALIMGVIL